MNEPVLVCLLAAHILGDFLLRPRREAWGGNASALLSRAGTHALLAYVLLGMWGAFPVPVAIFAVHVASEAAGSATDGDSVRGLLADQGIHVAAVILTALGVTALIADPAPFWVRALGPAYLQGLVLAAGFVLTVQGGGELIRRAVGPFVAQLERERQRKGAGVAPAQGLEGAGRLIGQMERSLVFLFLLIGQPAGLGFLVAAKSIFRIGELKDPGERMEAEYIILGTLMSFAYGIAAAYGTMRCLALM
jgi:hypothetical protein